MKKGVRNDWSLTGTVLFGSVFKGVRSSESTGVGNARAPVASRVARKQRTTPINDNIKTPTNVNVIAVKKKSVNKKNGKKHI